MNELINRRNLLEAQAEREYWLWKDHDQRENYDRWRNLIQQISELSRQIRLEHARGASQK